MRKDHLYFGVQGRCRVYATRRQIMDWLIWHIALEDTGSFEYPFRVRFSSIEFMSGIKGHVYINYSTTTPWDCYGYATEQIFKNHAVRKQFLELYYNF